MKIKGQVFMGNGDHTLADVGHCFTILNEAFAVLNEVQQVDSGRGHQEIGREAVEEYVRRSERRLKEIANELYVAITGITVPFVEKK